MSAAGFPTDFLDRLAAVVEARDGKRKGQEIVFTCPNPGHEDTHPSARYNVKKAAWTCDACGAGGGALDLAKLLGIDLPETRALTVVELARAKGLDADLLRSWGVRDGRRYNRRAVVIPYLANGEVRSERYRLSLDSPPISRKGDKARLYGEWRLEPGAVLIIEGESDAWTCWQNGVNAIGVPGANTWRAEWAEALADRDVFVWREPDKGGDTLVERVAASMPDVRIIEAPADAKDASALWLLTRDREAFTERLGALKAVARPASEIRAETISREASEALADGRGLLEDHALLDRVKDAITAGGWAGDATPPLLAYMALTSRLYEQPMNLAFIAESASGKSYAVDAALRLFPETAYHSVGASSAMALIYDEEADYEHRIVVVAEADSLPDEGPAASAVRALASENRMRYSVVERDEDTGKFRTRHIEKPGPTGLITTSTKPLEAQMSTRMLIVAISDTPAQTRAILHAQAAGVNGTRPEPPDVSGFHAAQRWLELAGDRDVSIPYATALAAKVPDALVRVRRDFSQLLALIAAVAILHQRQRERDQKGQIVAILGDYRIARELLLDVFNETVSGGVSVAVRETVGKVADLYGDSPVSISALTQALEFHRSTVYRRVQEALRLGFLVNVEERKGRPARLIPGTLLPEDRPALPEVESIRDYAHPETSATAQPDGDSPTYAVSGEAVAEAVATPSPVAQPATPVQPALQPVKAGDSDTNPALEASPVARLQSDQEGSKSGSNGHLVEAAIEEHGLRVVARRTHEITPNQT